MTTFQAYSNWGAMAKCSLMLRKYPFLNKQHSSSPAFTSHSSQSKVSLPIRAPVVAASLESRTALDSQSSNSGSSLKAQSGVASETKALDVASLLAATHTWVSEDSVEGIASSILRVLLQNTGASYGCFAYKDERGLRLRAAGSVDKMQVSYGGP
jgi:hypothetical protein